MKTPKAEKISQSLSNDNTLFILNHLSPNTHTPQVHNNVTQESKRQKIKYKFKMFLIGKLCNEEIESII